MSGLPWLAFHVIPGGGASVSEPGGIVLFDARVHEVGDWTVVTIVGELDLATVPQVRQKLHPVTGRNGAHVLIDLSGVDFMDSIGLGLLVGALKRVREHGGELAVVAPGPRVQRLVELTKLDRIIRFVPTAADVVRAPQVGEPAALDHPYPLNSGSGHG